MGAPSRLLPTRGFDAVASSAVPHRTVRAGRLPVGALEAAALACVDGTQSVDDIAATLQISPVECLAIVARLVELGGVSFGPERDDADARPTKPSRRISRRARGK